MEVTTSAYVRTARQVLTINVGRPSETDRETIRVSAGTNGFHKPDRPVINKPMADGYRRPSSYSCPALEPNQFAVDLTVDMQRVLTGNHMRMLEGGIVGTVPLSNLPVVQHNVNNVRMKLLNNIRSEVLDVAMVLAEISGTANTLANSLLRVARSMDELKRRKPQNVWYMLTGRRKDGRRVTDRFQRETAGLYLEWKYGIMPTVYDIQGACKGLDMNEDGSFFDNPPLMVARAVDRSVQQMATGAIQVVPPGQSRRTCEPSPSFRIVDELKARCDYAVSGEGLRGLNRYGLGLGSLATVAFDKTPFSFVLNMAVPIAELIKAWTALAGVDVRGYSETRYRRVDVLDSETSFQYAAADGDSFTVKIAGQENAYRSFVRTAHASPPMPLPYLRNPVKVGNVSTVLALFTQMRNPQNY